MEKKNFFKKYIGPRWFYEDTWRIAFPLALQSVLMSGQSMIDTLMVSWIGMVSAVGTAAQIDTLSGTISYGIVGGIGMFSSQFFGAKDYKSLKKCMGIGLILVMTNALFWILMATFFGREILGFYIQDEEVINNGLQYLQFMKFSLFIGGISFCFSNMFRSIRQPRVALVISILTALMNITLNYLLIFGVDPIIPALGVRGAGIATVISTTFSAICYIVYSISTKQPFLGSFKEMFGFSFDFVKPILSRILPLLINESIFGVGQTLFIKAFGMLGKTQMDAYYVGNQIFNLLTFIIFGYGNAVQILLGVKLGAGKIEEAKEERHYHMGLSLILSTALVIFMIIFGRPMVSLFRIADPIAENLAVLIVDVFAVKASMRLFNFVIFCILRSGGDAKIIQFLDAGLEWLVGLPAAFICVYFFKMESLPLVLLITQVEQLVRLILGMRRINTEIWAKDLTQFARR